MATRRFTIILALTTLCTLPVIASAKIDPACAAGTLAVEGTVRNVAGDPLGAITIELRQAGQANPLITTTTNGAGFYRICTGSDTYDVRARDATTAGAYATATREVSTFSSFVDDIDFTLQYKLNETVSPLAFPLATPSSSQLVTWKIRSKAPCVSYPTNCTVIRLTYGPMIGGTTVAVPFTGTEPGWNVWTYQTTLSFGLGPDEYFGQAKGGYLSGSTLVQTTELAIEPYWVDNSVPVFGPTSGSSPCGAVGFSPATTVNPLAIVNVGVCDPSSPTGAPGSGLDPYSVSVVVNGPSGGVTGGQLTLNANLLQYLPPSNWQIGLYKFTFTIDDRAGNETVSGMYSMQVSASQGSVPVISGPLPGELGKGANLGIEFGSQYTSTMSRPKVGFQIHDADGPTDISWGSLRVRVYGPDGQTLMYDYDPTLTACNYDSPQPCAPNAGYFSQLDGRFFAGGFSFVGKPPGFYVATASVSDHQGNTTSLTWRWVFVVAA